jgi:Helix-turn-helix domain
MNKLPTCKDHHPIYSAWNAMKNRCNGNYHSPERYSERGIAYCDRWADFKSFAEDMLPTWFVGATLDRIDNNEDYCLENCRWATVAQNSQNRSSTRLSWEKVEEIKKLYATGNYSQRALAAQFNVAVMTINHVLKGRCWKII